MVQEIVLEEVGPAESWPDGLARVRGAQVSLEGTLRDVLAALENGGLQIALIMKGQDRFEGIMTDGHVRRALLSGASLQDKLSSFVCRDFVSVTPRTPRAEVLDLMQALVIRHVPVVDENGRLQGIHLLNELIQQSPLENQAVILAGGKGTRLRPLTESIPKPLLKVAGRPILERLVLHLNGHGVKKIHLAINYLGHMIEEHFGQGEQFGCQISYLREERPLGTAGPLALLNPKPCHPILVMNGDLVTQFDVRALLEHHSYCENHLTIGTRPFLYRLPFGCLELDGQKVHKIEEKPLLTRMVNAGIYVLEPWLIDEIPNNEEFPMTELIATVLARGGRVGACEVNDDWQDIGRKDELDRARAGI